MADLPSKGGVFGHSTPPTSPPPPSRDRRLRSDRAMLFLGGPLHGQVRVEEATPPTYRLEVPPSLRDVIDAASEPVEPLTVTYTLRSERVLGGGTDDRRTYYALSTLDDRVAAFMLREHLVAEWVEADPHTAGRSIF